MAAFPINRWLIARGRGHAVVHKHHGQHSSPASSEQEHQMEQHAAYHVHH
jgi:hypothetical protein